MTPKFIFKPLAEHNLELLCTWFNEPHVKTWNDGLSNEEIKSKYLNRINNPDIRPFIAYLDDQPIGFIQYYYAHKIDNDWDLIEMESTVGLDQFIGEPDYINRGYGTKMIEQFVALLFSDAAIKKIIIDVDKNNQRAIRCYEKAGFSFLREITTSTSLLNLMVREKSNNLRH